MSKKKKEPEVVKDEIVESVEMRAFTYTCPVRGVVTQLVPVKKLKSKLPESKHMVRTNDPLIDDFGVSEIAGLTLDDEEPLPGGDI